MDKLFQPFSFHNKRLKNRCVVPPMVTNFCNVDGTCTKKFIAYHEARAKGEFGMIITEDFAVDPWGKAFPNVPGLWNDGQIKGFSKFTRTIHTYNTVVLAQIYHAGRQTDSAVTGHPPFAPSPIPDPLHKEMPLVLTLNQIKTIISQFGDCAKRAKKAGFDGVEIHGAHGYLIAQFMSPYSNKREDEYGGSFDRRMKFALEVIRDIRKKCGEDFIVGYRISGEEYVPGGRTLEETKKIVPLLEKEGINYIHLSAGVYGSIEKIMPSRYVSHAWLADQAAQIKAITSLPVIAVGRFTDPRQAEKVLEEGKADLISFGKQSLCDPETPKKAREGRWDEIRQCIGCLRGCLGQDLKNQPCECVLNPMLGWERFSPYILQTKPKNVLVVGAGPAGLQFAIAAAKCGHKVKVWEKEARPGGQFRLASVPPGKEEIKYFIDWQMAQLKKLEVSIHFHSEVTKSLIEKQRSEIVIAATGAVPIVPDIPCDNPRCFMTAHEVLSGKQTGQKVVIIGGGTVGAETAHYLAAQGKTVTLVEQKSEVAMDEMFIVRQQLLSFLKKYHVKICTETTVEKIEAGTVTLRGRKEQILHADTVVAAVGSREENKLAKKLEEDGCVVITIGDAVKPGFVENAIRQGEIVARALPLFETLIRIK